MIKSRRIPPIMPSNRHSIKVSKSRKAQKSRQFKAIKRRTRQTFEKVVHSKVMTPSPQPVRLKQVSPNETLPNLSSLK